MTSRPWSNSQMRRLGDALRTGQPVPDGCPSYDDVALWYLDLTVMIQQRIAGVDWSPLLGSRVPEITSRVKTIGTLREKLMRTPEVALQTVRDIAGVRFEADMSMSVETAVAETICRLFDKEADATLKDMRSDDHFGYRAVHVELRFREIAWRAEVQVRTELQGKWANMYEVAADILGRQIRYSDPVTDSADWGVVSVMRRLSTDMIADAEKRVELISHQELRVDDLRRSGAALSEIQVEENRLNQLRSKTEPLTAALSDQLQQLTDQLHEIRRST